MLFTIHVAPSARGGPVKQAKLKHTPFCLQEPEKHGDPLARDAQLDGKTVDVVTKASELLVVKVVACADVEVVTGAIVLVLVLLVVNSEHSKSLVGVGGTLTYCPATHSL